MLIKFFKTNYLLQYLLLILLGGMLWIGSFINPVEVTGSKELLTPGYNLLINMIGNKSLLSVILAFILTISGAFLFNYTLSKNDLIPKNTLIAALVYIVLMSYSVSFMNLNPAIIASVLLIIVLHFIFQVYTKEEAYHQVFNAGFLTGIASFFYFPSVFFILFIWLSFIVYSLYYWREWLIVLLGLITPYLFVWTYFFWFDELELVFEAYNGYFSNITFFHFDFNFSFIGYIISGIIILIFLWSFLWLIGDLPEKAISVRKRFWAILWLLFTSLFTYIFLIYDNNVVLLIVPISVFISYGFSQVKKTIWIEIIFIILALAIFGNNIYTRLF